MLRRFFVAGLCEGCSITNPLALRARAGSRTARKCYAIQVVVRRGAGTRRAPRRPADVSPIGDRKARAFRPAISADPSSCAPPPGEERAALGECPRPFPPACFQTPRESDSISAFSGGRIALRTSGAVMVTVVGLPGARVAAAERDLLVARRACMSRAEPRSILRSSAVRWPMISPFSRRM